MKKIVMTIVQWLDFMAIMALGIPVLPIGISTAAVIGGKAEIIITNTLPSMNVWVISTMAIVIGMIAGACVAIIMIGGIMLFAKKTKKAINFIESKL